MKREHVITWHDITNDKNDLPNNMDFCLIKVGTYHDDEYITDALYKNGVFETRSDEGGLEGVYELPEVTGWIIWSELEHIFSR
jgi:hypothetical protein